ncbi:hypothetical protein CBP52_00705 [Cellulomonas sp. PSBB021]|nr:hypothetical protein CBP52_00705 [Cellulomonas sp. PSBB021]
MFTAVHPTATTTTPPTPRPARRVLASGAVALTLAAALTGCTGGGTAAPTASATVPTTVAPTASASPTPSATPTPTALPSSAEDFSSIDLTVPPPRPDALDGPPSDEAAAEVARYFILMYPYAAATHDTTVFDELSYNDCGFCNRSLDKFREYEATGVETEGGAIIVHSAVAGEIYGNAFNATVTLSESPTRDVAPDGTVVDESPGLDNMVYDVGLKWYDGAWLVMSVTHA